MSLELIDVEIEKINPPLPSFTRDLRSVQRYKLQVEGFKTLCVKRKRESGTSSCASSGCFKFGKEFLDQCFDSCYFLAAIRILSTKNESVINISEVRIK